MDNILINRLYFKLKIRAILNPPRLPQQAASTGIAAGGEGGDVVIVFAGQVIGGQTSNGKFLITVFTLRNDAVCAILALGNPYVIAFVGMMPMVSGRFADCTMRHIRNHISKKTTNRDILNFHSVAANGNRM